MKSFSIVVAMDERNGIGKNGDLAWRLSADLKHFKEITTKTIDPTKKNAVIMGRKTWESLPEKFRPLPNRLNVVLTKMLPDAFRHVYSVSSQEVLVCVSLYRALFELNLIPEIEQIFVIGGGLVFQEAVKDPACFNLFMTDLKGNFGCDAFFPEIPILFKKIEESPLFLEGAIEYRFCHYQRSI